MFKSTPLKTLFIVLLIIMSLALPAQARLVAGGPETIIANSALILTGKVTKSMEKEEERTFTVKIDHVLKGDYQKEEITLTEKKNPVYGWVHIRHLPEINTGLLLFLCDDEDNGGPYFSFDMNCMALLEGQGVTGLLGGSNVGINDEHWETGDYVRAYNAFLNSAGPAETQANAINAVAGGENVALFPHDAANNGDSLDINDKISKNNGSSIGIIGGADGPTAIHVSGNPLKALLVPAIVLAAIFFAVGFGVGCIVKGKQTK
ncbi:MAG: sodium ion-translocating decarboxylase subunit beta [Firmicutes bacterium]|nr:sodium ion-translocating decarboxylase subunit beta [Bacillota bacterium]